MKKSVHQKRGKISTSTKQSSVHFYGSIGKAIHALRKSHTIRRLTLLGKKGSLDFRIDGDSIHWFNLYVHPKYTKRNFTGRMLKKLEQTGKKMKLSQVVIETRRNISKYGYSPSDFKSPNSQNKKRRWIKKIWI